MIRSHRELALLILLVGSACGDNTQSRSLRIVEPTPSAGPLMLCVADDDDTTLAGVQYDFKVAAPGFGDGERVTVAFDSDQPGTDTAMVLGEAASFSDVTVPEGPHALRAISADGKIRSAEVLVTDVNTAPAVMDFVTPSDEGEQLNLAHDADPDAPGLQFDLDVFAYVEDGQGVAFKATPPGDPETALATVTAMDHRATYRITFDRKGTWALRAEAATACGRPGSATISVYVDYDPPLCDVELQPTPLDAGMQYWNAALDLDPSPAAPGFQGRVQVTGEEMGDTIALRMDDATLGTMIAGAAGVATFDVTVGDGTHRFQADCTDLGGNVGRSLEREVAVDVVAPTCAVSPISGDDVVIPADDAVPGGAIDFPIDVTVGGGDADGEVADVDVTLGGATQSYSDTIMAGAASVSATANSPNDGTVALSAQDHAGNTCTATRPFRVETAGCSVTWTSPTGIVSTDGGAAPGVQVPVTITVGAACAGRTVTLSSCDVAGPLSAAATGTTASFTVTACASQSCSVAPSCTASVTSPAGIVTSVTTTMSVDTVPPNVTLLMVSPPTASCGGTVTSADDSNPGLAGVQIRMQNLADPSAVSRWFRVNGGAPIPVDASYVAELTLAFGANSIVGYAEDAAMLVGSSPPCSITLSDLGLTISSPTDGEALGTTDGVVSGSNLLVDVRGTVTNPAATVTILVDGAMAGTATVTGTTWSTGATIALPSSPAMHTITANGLAGPSMGSASVGVTVDIVVPPPATGVTATATARNAVRAGWTAPTDGAAPVNHCDLRRANAAITTDAAWAGATLVASIPGASPGQADDPRLELGPGHPWHYAVRCFDGAGNPSALATAGPVVLHFTQSAGMTPAVVSGYRSDDAWYGIAVTGADLDDDGFDDLAVGASNSERMPYDGLGEGLVHVYMGGPTGVGSSPDFVIRGTDSGNLGYLGASLATLDWNGDGVDDLAVGAAVANGGNGKVAIFYGSGTTGWNPIGSTQYKNDTDAEATLVWDGANDAAFFSVGFLGWRLAPVDFDGDGRQDLLIGAPGAAGFKGGAVLVFGGAASPSGTIAIPSGLAAAGTKAYGFSFATVSGIAQYGGHLGTLGVLGNGPGTDTREDIAIAPEAGAVSGANPTLSEDRVFVYYGRARPSPGDWAFIAHTSAEEQVLAAPEADDTTGFGNDVGSIADQDGDGRRDLIVTAPLVGASDGRVYLVPGGTNLAGGTQVVKDLGVAGTAFMTITGGSGAVFGRGLANPALRPGAGSDVDGDGAEDLAVISLSFATLHVWLGGGLAGTVAAGAADDIYLAPAGFERAGVAAWCGQLNAPNTGSDALSDLVWADPMDSFQSVPPAEIGAAQVLY